MVFLKKVNGLVLGLVVLLTFGCGGGDEPAPVTNPNPGPIQGTCRLAGGRAILWGYTYEYIYNSAGQVIKASRISGDTNYNDYELVDYDSNGLIWRTRRRKIGTNVNIGYTLFEYGPDLLLKKETIFRPINPSDTTAFKVSEEIRFNYNGAQQLSQVIYYSPNQSTSPIVTYNYTYQQDGSLLLEQFNNTKNKLEQTKEYHFASFPNPVKNVAYFEVWNTNSFSLFAGLPDTRFTISILEKNYDDSGNIYSQSNFKNNYSINNYGYPEQLFDNSNYLIATWTYDCQ